MIVSIILSVLTNNISFRLDSYSELRLYAYSILIEYWDKSRSIGLN